MLCSSGLVGAQVRDCVFSSLCTHAGMCGHGEAEVLGSRVIIQKNPGRNG